MIGWLKNISISKKLTAGFSVVIILGLFLGSLGVINLIALSRAEQNLFDDQMMAAQEISNAMEKLMIIRVNARDLYIYADKNKTDYYNAIDESISGIDLHLNNLNEMLTEDSDAAELDQLKQLFAQYKESVGRIVTASKAGVSNSDLLDTIVDGKTIGNDTQNAFKSFAFLLLKEAGNQVDNDERTATRTIMIMAAVTIISLICAIITVRLLTEIIAKPLKKIADCSSMLAVGDLNIEKVFGRSEMELRHRKDELGTLAQSFNQLITSTQEQADKIKSVAEGDLTVSFKVRSEEDVIGLSLSEVVTQLNSLIMSIYGTSEQVAAGARLVSDSSVSLSQGAAEQAASIEELTASINEIAGQSKQTAQKVSHANELANSTKESALAESRKMQEMMKAMGQINDCTGSVYKIIKVIDEIAFQTNILALNAAVEAARAGQHGKGFAVVAEEVRALASKSASAVKETTALIQNSISSVKTGTDIAADTMHALEHIVVQAEETAALIGSVTEVTKEQSMSIDQIDHSIALVSQVVQTVAATAEESAAASEELSNQSAQLMEDVGYFTINSGGAEYSDGPKVRTGLRNTIDIRPKLLKSS